MVEWVKKALFARLNKLFEITTSERNYQMLLSARNLLAVVREPQPYVLNILPRQLPKVVVPEEHFVLRDLPFYEEAREADAKVVKNVSSNGRIENRRGPYGGRRVRRVTCNQLRLIFQQRRKRRWPL